jgi:hypothetical protein
VTSDQPRSSPLTRNRPADYLTTIVEAIIVFTSLAYVVTGSVQSLIIWESIAAVYLLAGFIVSSRRSVRGSDGYGAEERWAPCLGCSPLRPAWRESTPPSSSWSPMRPPSRLAARTFSSRSQPRWASSSRGISFTSDSRRSTRTHRIASRANLVLCSPRNRVQLSSTSSISRSR